MAMGPYPSPRTGMSWFFQRLTLPVQSHGQGTRRLFPNNHGVHP